MSSRRRRMRLRSLWILRIPLNLVESCRRHTLLSLEPQLYKFNASYRRVGGSNFVSKFRRVVLRDDVKFRSWVNALNEHEQFPYIGARRCSVTVVNGDDDDMLLIYNRQIHPRIHPFASSLTFVRTCRGAWMYACLYRNSFVHVYTAWPLRDRERTVSRYWWDRSVCWSGFSVRNSLSALYSFLRSAWINNVIMPAQASNCEPEISLSVSCKCGLNY